MLYNCIGYILSGNYHISVEDQVFGLTYNICVKNLHRFFRSGTQVLCLFCITTDCCNNSDIVIMAIYIFGYLGIINNSIQQ